jgi:hypothetical protein
MDWLLEAVSVWEVPVTTAMLHAAHPAIPKRVYVHALRQLVEAGVLYTTPGGNDQAIYFPVCKRPVCDLQMFLCKGRIE